MARSLPPAPADEARSFEDTAELVLAPTRSWAFVAALTVCFGLTEAWLVHSGRFIHDEGLLTWLYASYLSHDPVATLFFLKAKPALAALNLPGSAFGLMGFYAGHILTGCAGILTTAAAARAARIREWGIAALLCACSPGYLFGTAAGFSNVDAAALTAVAVWMIFRHAKPGFGTAFAISLLPWIRFEAAVFVVASALALLRVIAIPGSWRDCSRCRLCTCRRVPSGITTSSGSGTSPQASGSWQRPASTKPRSTRFADRRWRTSPSRCSL
jgi:hypothetical protein